MTLAFFGIRGVGSVYYLAYGLNQINAVEGSDRLWAVVGLIILLSILMHGVTVTPVMRLLDRRRAKDQPEDSRPEAQTFDRLADRRRPVRKLAAMWED